MPDEFSPSLGDLAVPRRPTALQQWQQAVNQNRQQQQRYGTESQQRLSGLPSGLADVASRAWEGSLPAHLRDMYRDLQAGAAPEDLAGQSFDAALGMLGYGMGIPGGELDANTLAALRMRRRDVMPGEKLMNYWGGTRHHLIDDAGNVAGFVDVKRVTPADAYLYKGNKGYDPNKIGAYIGMIGRDENQPFGGGRGGYNKVGADEIRSMLPELLKHYPDIEQVGGFRVGGMRTGKSEAVWVPLDRIRKLLASDRS
jgi:hypothetical protein